MFHDTFPASFAIPCSIPHSAAATYFHISWPISLLRRPYPSHPHLLCTHGHPFQSTVTCAPSPTHVASMAHTHISFPTYVASLTHPMDNPDPHPCASSLPGSSILPDYCPWSCNFCWLPHWLFLCKLPPSNANGKLSSVQGKAAGGRKIIAEW